MKSFWGISLIVVWVLTQGGCGWRDKVSADSGLSRDSLQKDTVYLKVTDTGFRLYCIPDVPEKMQKKPGDIEPLGEPLYLVADIMKKGGDIVYEWAPEAITEMPIKYKIGNREFDGDIKGDILIAPYGSPDAIVIEAQVVDRATSQPGRRHSFRIPFTIVADDQQGALVVPLMDEVRLYEKEADAVIYYSGMIIVR